MKFAVLGLGESIQEFKPGNNIETIGCNDIWKHYPTKYLICVDPKRVFTPERLKTIKSSTPLKFFSYLHEWEEDFLGHFELMIRNTPRSSLMTLDKHPDKVCYSICSPYIACVKAYQLGADEIVLHGVDFNTHKSLSSNVKQIIIKRDFINLFNELAKRNVKLFVGSEKSFLAGFIPIKKN